VLAVGLSGYATRAKAARARARQLARIGEGSERSPQSPTDTAATVTDGPRPMEEISG